VRQRLQSFFYSRRNLAGLVLAFGGLTLYAFGILGAPAWIPITAGLYAVGYLLMPTKPDPGARVEAAEDEADLRDDLSRLLREIRGKVADDLYAKAWNIRKSILAILEVEGLQDSADPNVYLIRQTALTYLPEAFETYLRVPRLMAEQRPIANGRTPHDVLLDQLDLMDQRLAEVSEDILRHDSDKLLANGRFLAEKFGRSPFRIDDSTEAAADAASLQAPETTSTTGEVAMAETTSTPVNVAAASEPAQVDEQVAERERVH
jgi:hypothetical protein